MSLNGTILYCCNHGDVEGIASLACLAYVLMFVTLFTSHHITNKVNIKLVASLKRLYQLDAWAVHSSL